MSSFYFLLPSTSVPSSQVPFDAFSVLISPSFNTYENGLSGHSFKAIPGVWRSTTYRWPWSALYLIFSLIRKNNQLQRALSPLKVQSYKNRVGKKGCTGERNLGT